VAARECRGGAMGQLGKRDTSGMVEEYLKSDGYQNDSTECLHASAQMVAQLLSR